MSHLRTEDYAAHPQVINILESIADGFIALDWDWRFVYLNRQAENILKRTRVELVGQDIWQVFPQTVDTQFNRQFHQAMASQQPVEFEELWAPSARWFEVRLFPSPRGLAVYFRDITQHKFENAERVRLQPQNIMHHQLLEAVLWEIPAGVTIAQAPSGKIIYRNPQSMLIFGKQPVIGKRSSMGVTVKNAKSGEHLLMQDDLPLARALKNGETVVAEELQIEKPDGTHRIVSVSAAPIKDAHGNIVAAVAISQDVSNQKRTYAELETARQAAEAANRAKDQFLAVLSHELRTPLSPVLATAISLLHDSRLPEPLSADVQTIKRNVELEARLIDDILDAARIVHGKLSLQFESVNIDQALLRAVGICRPDIRAKDLHLTWSMYPRKKCVDADPVRLQQILWNLLRNAIKFTPPGGNIRVETANTPDGRSMTVRVIDDGIGIEPEVLPRIFKPFEQGETKVSRRFGGLGLGLMITKNFVEAHGGTLTAESLGKGRGATFTVTLPLAEEQGSQSLEVPSAFIPAVSVCLKILLVEDHLDTAAAMAKLLGKLGHQVTVAHGVGSAVELASVVNFDLLISDIGLPDGTGIDVVKRIKELRPVDAIALTGYGMEADVQACLDAGFGAHLTKPVNFDALRKLIQNVSAKIHARKEANH